MTSETRANRPLRSQEWFDNPNNPGMTALCVAIQRQAAMASGCPGRAGA